MSNSTSDDLSKKKAAFIASLNFEKAEEIEELIQEKKKNDINVMLNNAKSSMKEKIQQVHQLYEDNCKNIQLNKEDAEMKIRETIDIKFEAIQDRHLEELTEVERNYAFEVYKANERPVKAQLEHFALSKKMAKINNFKEAIAMRELGNQLYQQELENRRKEIQGKYQSIRNVLFEKQKNELLQLNKKLRTKFTQLELALNRELETQKKLLCASIRSEQQKWLVKFNQEKFPNDDKKKMSEQLKLYVNSTTYEVTGIPFELKDIPIPKIPPKKKSQNTSQPSTPKSKQQPKVLSVEEEDNSSYESEINTTLINQIKDELNHNHHNDDNNDLFGDLEIISPEIQKSSIPVQQEITPAQNHGEKSNHEYDNKSLNEFENVFIDDISEISRGNNNAENLKSDIFEDSMNETDKNLILDIIND